LRGISCPDLHEFTSDNNACATKHDAWVDIGVGGFIYRSDSVMTQSEPLRAETMMALAKTQMHFKATA
jgi:hypothetical protein